VALAAEVTVEGVGSKAEAQDDGVEPGLTTIGVSPAGARMGPGPPVGGEQAVQGPSPPPLDAAGDLLQCAFGQSPASSTSPMTM